MLQWKAYDPAFIGATNVFDDPAVISPVSNDLSSAATVWVVESEFLTVTIAPALTLTGAPNWKFLIVMVSDAPALVPVELVADLLLELQAAAPNAATITRANEHATRRRRR